jgi:hypothetical protein
MTIVSLVTSATLPVRPQDVWNDTNRFIMNNKKDAYAKEMGVEIDELVLDLYRPIDEICPTEIQDSYKVISTSIQENNSIASLTAHDAPVPMTGAGSIEQGLVSMSKLSIGIAFNEDQQIQYDELKQSGQLTNAYVEMLTTNIDDLQYKIARLTVVMAVQAMMEGRVNWTDPRTGLNCQIGYNFIPSLFPAPLTGARRWSQATTATGIRDIITHANLYYDKNGFRPKYIYMRYETMLMLAEQTSTREFLISMGMISATGGGNAYVTLERLQAILKGMLMPELRIWDAQVQIEPKPGVFERVNVVKVGAYFFANPKMGRRVFGKVLEAKGKPGIFVDTDPKDRKATEEKVQAIARMVPFYRDAKLLAAATVN